MSNGKRGRDCGSIQLPKSYQEYYACKEQLERGLASNSRSGGIQLLKSYQEYYACKEHQLERGLASNSRSGGIQLPKSYQEFYACKEQLGLGLRSGGIQLPISYQEVFAWKEQFEGESGSNCGKKLPETYQDVFASKEVLKTLVPTEPVVATKKQKQEDCLQSKAVDATNDAAAVFDEEIYQFYANEVEDIAPSCRKIQNRGVGEHWTVDLGSDAVMQNKTFHHVEKRACRKIQSHGVGDHWTVDLGSDPVIYDSFQKNIDGQLAISCQQEAVKENINLGNFGDEEIYQFDSNEIDAINDAAAVFDAEIYQFDANEVEDIIPSFDNIETLENTSVNPHDVTNGTGLLLSNKYPPLRLDVPWAAFSRQWSRLFTSSSSEHYKGM